MCLVEAAAAALQMMRWYFSFVVGGGGVESRANDIARASLALSDSQKQENCPILSAKLLKLCSAHRLSCHRDAAAVEAPLSRSPKTPRCIGWQPLSRPAPTIQPSVFGVRFN